MVSFRPQNAQSFVPTLVAKHTTVTVDQKLANLRLVLPTKLLTLLLQQDVAKMELQLLSI